MTDLVQSFAGQCRIQVDSTTQISLQRYQGRYINLIVSSALIARLIPASGPTISNGGLSASTLYYVYAFDNSGTLTLELSTTGHVTDSTFGIETKSGDATRALVGMVFTDGSTHFLDSTTNRYCLNWFNRRSLDLVNTFSTDRSTTSTSFTEINTEIRVNFLSWADETTELGIYGTFLQTTSGQACGTAIGIDSTSVVTQGVADTFSGFANTHQTCAVGCTKTLSEGQHFATLLGAVSGGTGFWDSADSVGSGPMKVRLWATIRG
jgi:hypothetical protein